MQLTRKLTFAIALGVMLVLGVSGALQTRREVDQFERDNSRDHHVLATKLAAAVAEVRRLEGDRVAADVVAHASGPSSTLRIRWVRLEADAPGEPPLLPALARRATEHATEMQQVDPSGPGVLVTYHPVLGGGAPALIEVSESLADERAYTRVTKISVAATTIAAGMVCILMAYLLGASIVGAPIRKLVEKARRVGRGDLSEPLELRAKDELGLLAREMNAMCDNLAAAMAKAEAETAARISALEQLRHADRLATVGKLAAGIAHELGTPLNVVSGRARMIESEVTEEQARGSARVIAEQAQRMAAIIRQLLDFARQRGPQMGNVDLSHLAREAVDLLAPLGKKRKVRVEIAATSQAHTATVSRSHMLQAVMNLIVNAIQASREGSVVHVEVGRSDEEAAGPMATLTVTDHGQGMSREVTDHAFEPFFTTKGVGEGTGLGLSVTYGIVTEHRGFITVHSEVGRGSTFRIHLPLAADDANREIAELGSRRAPGPAALEVTQGAAGQRLREDPAAQRAGKIAGPASSRPM